MQIRTPSQGYNENQENAVSLLRYLMRKGVVFVRRLTTFRYGVVLIFRHTKLCDVSCPAEIRSVNWDNVNDALDMAPPKMTAQFRALLQDGQAGYYAYFNGQVRHRSWVQFGPGIARCELGVKFRLEAGESYVHYSETHPSMQGQRLYSAVLSQIAHDMHTKGQTVFIATVRNNPASIRGIEKAGFRLLRRVRSIICFGIPLLQKDLKENT